MLSDKKGDLKYPRTVCVAFILLHLNIIIVLLVCFFILNPRLWFNLDKELATLRAEAEHKVREIEDKCMVLRDELNSSLAKAAVKQEAIYKVEEAKESL